MNALDWTVIAVYMAAMILMSVWLGRGQEDQEDYYVGGRNLPWWAVGVSTMATQTSAVSFISVPAFVAMREGGGLTWLQNELAVPLAMVFIMALLLPLFRHLELISVYEYLERRFGSGTRSLLAGVFLLSRGLGTGVGIYASAIPLAVALETDLAAMILTIGVVTLVYDTIGGMKAVVYSDVLQMVILLGGIALCIGYALDAVGGWGAALGAHDPGRFVALEMTSGIGDGGKFPFWAFLVGGFFLYGSYYGADQSQAQRELSTPSLDHTKYSLIFNGFVRLPLTIAYIGLGIAVGAVFATSPEAAASIPARSALPDFALALMPESLQQLLQSPNPDYMVPTFVLSYLPHGIKALIFASILAASMSSLDSALNSLSAATMQDFIDRYLPRLTGTPRRQLWMGKLTTVAWGLLIIFFAFLLGGEDTVVERINKVGSAFYGPILAAFVTGVTIRRVSGAGMVAGILAGVATNIALWIGFQEQLFWMWWNLVGLAVAMVVALLVSLAAPQREDLRGRDVVLWDTELWSEERRWLPSYGLLVAYFAGMLALMAKLPAWLGS